MSGTDTTLSAAHEQLLQLIAGLTAEQLAPAIAHEYDEETTMPPPGSAGEEFLLDVRADFVRWVRREGRFPRESEAGEVLGAGTQDRRPPSRRAQAFVDLGLFWSHHADASHSADITGLGAVLDEAGEQIVVNLTRDYGPLV